VFGIAQVGTIYTTGSKIAEHGGDNPGDRDVPLVVYAPSNVSPGQSDQWVENTHVAPTILKLLGLDPNQLQAVQEEGTQVLPGIERHWRQAPLTVILGWRPSGRRPGSRGAQKMSWV
jgi:hypothetical protein